MFPVAVVCNKIGDVFVLDAGAACLFGFDRFSVAKSYIVGSHMSPSLQNYDQCWTFERQGFEVQQ